MKRPKNCKSCGKKMQVGGLQPYTQANTAAGAITPTGQSSLAANSQLSPEEIQSLSQQYGFRTDNNQNFQQDLFNYAQKNQPQAYSSVMDKFGQTNAGTFVDGMLGARTSNLARSLQRPAPTQDAPQQAALTEWLYGTDKHSFGTASQPYRDSKSASDPGIMNGPEGPEYVDFMYNKPESQETDAARGRYRIPYNVWSNLVTKGTTTVMDPSVIEQYRPSSLATMRRHGGKMQIGGSLYPYTTAEDELIPGLNAPMPEPTQAQPSPIQDAINKGLIEAPKGYPDTQTWYDFMNTPADKKRQPATPKNWKQNLGIGMMGLRALGSEISGRVARGRQNQYDMQQQVALGMMNPMPTDDYQPNPYSLYARYGGKLRNYQNGGAMSYKPPMPDYVFMGPPTKKDSQAYSQHFNDYLYNQNNARNRWDASGSINQNAISPDMYDSIQNMWSAWSDAEDDMLTIQYRKEQAKQMKNNVGSISAGAKAAQASIAKLKAGLTLQQGGQPSYNFSPNPTGMSPQSDSASYRNAFQGMASGDPFHAMQYGKMMRYGLNPITLSPQAYAGASNDRNAYQDAIGQASAGYNNLRQTLPFLPQVANPQQRYGGLQHVDYFGPPFSNGATYKFSDAERYDKVLINRKLIPELFLRGKKRK